MERIIRSLLVLGTIRRAGIAEDIARLPATNAYVDGELCVNQA
jgi:hypothetical protein